MESKKVKVAEGKKGMGRVKIRVQYVQQETGNNNFCRREGKFGFQTNSWTPALFHFIEKTYVQYLVGYATYR